MGWLRELWTQIWITLVVAAVSLALYTSAGRQLIPLAETWKPDIEQQLSAILKQPVVIGQMTGGWSRLSPLVRFNDVQLGEAGDGISIRSMEAELDVSASLFYRLPVFRRIEIEGIRAEVHQTGERDWRIGSQWPVSLAATDHPAEDSTDSGQQKAPQSLWLTLLSLQQTVIFRDWQLVAFDIDNTREEMNVTQLVWRNQGDSHEVDGTLSWGREQVANVRVAASLEGDLWPWKNQDGEVYLDVQPQEWSRWIPSQLPAGLSITRLTAGAQAWLSIRNGDLYAARLDADVPAFSLTTRGEPVTLTAGRLTLAGRHNGDDWHLQLKPEFHEPLPFTQLSLSAVTLPASKGWQIGIPAVDLAAARDFLMSHQLVPEPFDRYIDATGASGMANDVRVSVIAGEHPKVDVRAHLNEVSSLAYHGIPAFSGLTADLHLQPAGGVLTVAQDDLSLHLEDVYAEPWVLKDVSGRFFWALNADYAQLQVRGLQGSLVQIQDDGSSKAWPLGAELAMATPLHNSHVESSLSLLVGLPSVPASLKSQLVPKILDDGIRKWIDDSILDGQFSDGAFILNSELGQDHPANSLTTQLYLGFDKTRIRYLQDWPEISDLRGRMLLRSPELDVRIETGNTLGGTLAGRNGRIQIVRGADGLPHLSVNANLEGTTTEGLKYLTDTPLAEVVHHALDDWQAEGPMKAHLLMDMPLGGEHPTPDVQFEAELTDNQLTLNNLRLSVNNLNGTVKYSTRYGLLSNWLEGDMFGGHFSGGIDSKVHAGGFDMVLSGKGEAGMDAFKEWLPLFLLDPVSGRLTYDARLLIGGDGVRFALNSPLTGTVIDLPAPMGKTAGEERPLQVEVMPGAETRINMNYASRVRLAMAMGAEGVDRGQVYLGDSEPFLPADKGIEIRGAIPETLNAEAWWGAWQKLMAAAARTSASEPAKAPAGATQESGPVRSMDVTLADVDAWGMAMGPTHVLGTQQWNEWDFTVNSTLVQGNILLKPDNQPIVLNLDYIHLPESSEADATEAEQALAVADAEVADAELSETALNETAAAGPVAEASEGDVAGETAVAGETLVAEEKPDPLLAMQPADLPALDLKLGELYIGSRNFGAWNIQSRPVAGGANFHITDSDMKGLIFNGDVRWLREGDQHTTALDVLNITSKDIGRVQRAFRQEAAIEGKDMNSALQLSWTGSPMAFNTRTLNGLTSIRIKDGHMAAEGAGALKAFGALNFNSVARRLKLDFSDLYQSGVAFDTLKGKAKIENGLLTLTEPLSLDGPGAKFLTTGSTSLVDESLNMKLVVTFPVSSTLPLVALLAGLAPPVAASIYVTEKLIGDELSRFTSASYDLKGSWQKPDLKINQAFDNKVEGKKDRGLWERVKSVFQIFGGDD
ncbi:YhdP family protein [Thalassolituus sp. LLYu03]|uniref:YhdP family protein n=1 Tax=Thalassolituus sp. LLYu03 TaxID=3421656 RepID=UPI003D2C91A5